MKRVRIVDYRLVVIPKEGNSFRVTTNSLELSNTLRSLLDYRVVGWTRATYYGVGEDNSIVEGTLYNSTTRRRTIR